MGLTAVILTFNRVALTGSLLVAALVFTATIVVTRRRQNPMRLALLLAGTCFLLAMFGFWTFLGLGAGTSIEVITYGMED